MRIQIPLPKKIHISKNFENKEEKYKVIKIYNSWNPSKRKILENNKGYELFSILKGEVCNQKIMRLSPNKFLKMMETNTDILAEEIEI